MLVLISFFQCCTLLCWNFNNFATEILYLVSYNLNEEKHSNKGFIINRPDSTGNYVAIMIIKTCFNFLGQSYTESSSLSVGTFVGKKKNSLLQLRLQCIPSNLKLCDMF